MTFREGVFAQQMDESGGECNDQVQGRRFYQGSKAVSGMHGGEGPESGPESGQESPDGGRDGKGGNLSRNQNLTIPGRKHHPHRARKKP